MNTITVDQAAIEQQLQILLDEAKRIQTIKSTDDIRAFSTAFAEYMDCCRFVERVTGLKVFAKDGHVKLCTPEL